MVQPTAPVWRANSDNAGLRKVCATASSCIGRGHYFALIDGAVFANAPELYAHEAAHEFQGAESQPTLLLSVGTGQAVVPVPYQHAWGWGLLFWSGPLIDIMFSVPAENLKDLHSMMYPLMDYPNTYVRLEPKLAVDNAGLDDARPSNIRALEATTQQYLREGDNSMALKALTALLMRPRPAGCPISSP